MNTTFDYRSIELIGGNSNGYIYSNYQVLADGIHMGYNFYYRPNNTATPIPFIPVPAGGTSRITTSYGKIELATGASNTIPSTKMIVDSSGITATNGAKFVGNLDGNGRSDMRWLATSAGKSAGGVGHLLLCAASGA